jgi:small conductance mechanosensitive channel
MIQNAQTPAPVEPGTPVLDVLMEQLQSFIAGIFSLDPQQAAIRAGLTLLVVIGAALLVWGLRLMLKALVERVAPDEASARIAQPARVGRWTLRIARAAIAVAAILVILRVWGFEFDDLREGPLGAAFAVATRVVVILVVAFGAIELAGLAIGSLFARIAQRARSARRSAQVRTLAPLLSGVVTTALIVIAAMMALSEIGVEIGPLIAGAGIIGLAIGFGAQTLVKDFLTGIFLIIEDIVSVGDIVQIGEFGGLVEEMSLRTIKLRNFDGTLHVFPYSEAQVIHNRTKSFSFAVFDLSVSYSTDISLALEQMQRVGDELKDAPEFAEMILSPIEVVGVDRLGDSGVILKARIKTAPGMQWAVGREYLKRIKLAFDAAGIEIPFPHVKLVASDQSQFFAQGK